MKSKSRIVWGLSLLLVALALVLFAFRPDLALGRVSIWKIIIAVLLSAWIIERLFFSEKISDRFDVFIPIGLSLLLFEKEIAFLLGKNENLYSGWLVIIGSILLTVSLHIIFPDKKYKPTPKENIPNQNTQNRFSNRTVYFDACANYKLFVDNSFGTTSVYFNNTEAADDNIELELIITNKFGNVEVYVPREWFIECKNTNSFGDTKYRENTCGGKKLTILGSCSFGQIEIK